MSTWTSEPKARRGFWLPAALVLLLAGCFEAAPLARFTDREAEPGPTRLSVFDGALTVAGPEGYCVDRNSTVENASEAFVLLVACRASERQRPVLAATVTALPAEAARGTENLRTLMTAVTSEAGRGHLSRSGQAGDVRIESAAIENGAIWLRINDRGSPETFAPDYWRAILPVGGRVVSLSVLDARAAPGSAEEGRAILRGFAARMRTVNGR